MKYLPLVIAFICVLGCYSCEKSNEISPTSNNGGIAITFDDRHISEWLLADSILKDFQWNATFYIPYFDKLTVEEIQQLHELNIAGHEIAGHGLNHLNAVSYISSGAVNDYLTTEILPMIELMAKEGFSTKSFAYPFGLRNQETDSVLLKYFDIIRGVDRGLYNDISEHNCFFDYSAVVLGRGIDTDHHPYFDRVAYEKYIQDLLTYARDNNKILIVYCHIPVEKVTGDSQISISTLELICNFIEENKMRYYTLSDLIEMLE